MERTVKVKKLSNLIRRKLLTIGNSKQCSHYQILLFIRDREHTFQRDIDRQFSLQRPTTTEILRIMENNGFITKKGTKEDLRLKEILITPKGIESVKNFEQPLNDVEENFVKDISAKDLATFDKVIDKMIKNGEENWYK